VADSTDLVRLLMAIAAGDRTLARSLLDAQPQLATARVARRDEFFLARCHAQVYEGDTALHAAALAYDTELAGDLMARGAEIRARNRRGAEPLHAAVTGVPGADNWDPVRQRTVIDYLIDAGADQDAAAVGGVTPLHRAVRNRCSAAVEALLASGANPDLVNDSGSKPSDLARRATGRGGVGSPAAKSEQRIIIDLLNRVRTPGADTRPAGSRAPAGG
jgi:ankyrin repeat protein